MVIRHGDGRTIWSDDFGHHNHAGLRAAHERRAILSLGEAMPRVTICVPTYNRSAYLRESVASVLSQEFSDFEVLICDDASTDETPAVIRELCASDPRVSHTRHTQNVGSAQAVLKTLARARGTYFA